MKKFLLLPLFLLILSGCSTGYNSASIIGTIGTTTSQNPSAAITALYTTTDANVRSCPSTNCKVIGTYSKNTNILAGSSLGQYSGITDISQLPEWVILNYINDWGIETMGYINKSVLSDSETVQGASNNSTGATVSKVASTQTENQPTPPANIAQAQPSKPSNMDSGMFVYLFALTIVLAIKILFVVLCYNIAKKKGKNTGLAIFWGIIFGLFAVLVYCILKPSKKILEKEMIAEAEKQTIIDENNRKKFEFENELFEITEPEEKGLKDLKTNNRFCRNCGDVIKLDSKFCSHCGTKLI
jgi:hypothetical protein